MSIASLLPWSAAFLPRGQTRGIFTATFIIDVNEQLWVAERRSEHVACADGQDVCAAGEITFERVANQVYAVEVTNQSTGFASAGTRLVQGALTSSLQVVHNAVRRQTAFMDSLGGGGAHHPIPKYSMKRSFSRLLIAALMVVTGCNSKTATAPTDKAATTGSPASGSTSPPHDNDERAEYSFHRNVAFKDVTKDMPAGSVDHIDFSMAAQPNVIVIVTVSTNHKEGLRFTTTFTGRNNLKITKEWQPASGSGPKGRHVALFVLPEAVDAGSTVVH